MGAVMSYFLNVLIGIDQLVNALIGGWPDETISARAFRAEAQGRALGKAFRPMIDCIFWPLEERHCEKAFASEVKKMQLPDEYRKS